MRRVVASLVAILAAVAVPALALAQPAGPIVKDPVAWHQKYIDAVNAGDMKSALSMFADNATYSGGLTCSPARCSGRAAIEKELAALAAQHIRITRTAASAFVGEVTSQEEHRADIIKAAGVDRVIVLAKVKFRDEKIASVDLSLDTRDPQTAKYAAYIRSAGAAAPTAASVTAAAPSAAAPPVAPARLPSTGSIGMTSDPGSPWLALATIITASAFAGAAIARRRLCDRPSPFVPNRRGRTA